MKSQFLSLNLKDVIKGGILAFIIAFLTGVMQLLQSGPVSWTFTFWEPTFIAAIIAFIGYILKNLITNSQDQFLKKE